MASDPADRAVCVSGMAWHTALGTDLNDVWQRLLRGDTGDSTASADATEQLVRLATLTAKAALRNAGIGVDLLVLGSSLGASLDGAAGNTWTGEVAEALGVRQPPVSLSTACSSGSDAVLTAAALIRAGVADRVLCGGVDVLSEAKRLGHSALGTLSPTEIRPFDADRDGTVLGEGAGFLVLESREAARARGAQVWGEVRGWGSSNDASGPTAPDRTGGAAVLAVRRALKKAGARAEDIAVINAHGTGTPSNDATEAACYTTLYGDGAAKPILFATKASFGHTLGATGAIEVIALLLALHHGKVPPLARTRSVMAELPLPVGPSPVEGKLGFSLTLGFGGFNTCLVVAA
ncbi:beta-ketoacyl-[acyl-carrier-protein] synthase family protein [Allokutzneria sp. A3M-2-11 16]|uniref:beta-ketoacyl-[acyl-carrier-protein] synthase family protein n=1 Tax=Allokutzneria sp. A3M-2-11 16 TaxID=2962043 RepID=UPI0020B8ACB5|nr:beta-ketoacyl-[acyl-carrier-protein] synthase family protein [Allokutzneria sp. A3M-2-11 16]MCP3803124.1 beta-ketoacyl-[acyl-carrier-protein] synthase family protein [Allokutzneria sp. A3M-2-11 16]